MIILVSILWHALLLFRIDRFVWADGILEPWFVTKGLMFEKDFYSTYLPLPKILMIPINILTNWNMATTVIIGFLLVVACLYLIHKFSFEITNNKLAANLSVVFFSVWYMFILKQNTMDINLLLGFLITSTFYVFVKWLKNSTKKKVFLMGILGFSAVFTIQHSIIDIGIIFLSAALYIYINKKNLKFSLFGLLFPILLSFIVVAGPILIWFYLRGALSDLYFWAVDYYLRDTGYPFTRLGFSASDVTLIIMFSLPFALLTFQILINIFEKNKKKMLSLWIPTTLWVILLASFIYALFAIFHPRRLMFILPLNSIAISYIYSQFLKNKNTIYKYTFVLCSVVFLIYFLRDMVPWFTQKIISGTKVDYYNVSYPHDPEYKAILWIKTYTKPNDTLFVLAGNNLNFFEADRLPANNRTYPIPWVYEPFDELKYLLKNKPAKYWIVDERLVQRFVSWGYPHIVEYINTLLKTDYKEVARYDEWMVVYKKIN